MAEISITDQSIPDLSGKHAVVTGGSSGLGLVCCHLLAARHVERVYVLDVQHLPAGLTDDKIVFYECDVSDWFQLQKVFSAIPRIDLLFVNAGCGQGGSPLELKTDPATGQVQEPCKRIIDVNYRGALNTAVLGVLAMKRQDSGGSVVFTGSATGYSAERGLPVYSSLKLGIVGLVRAWRTELIAYNITVNAVAPAAFVSGLMPADAGAELAAKGLKVSTPEHVARAMVFPAIANEDRRVEAYGLEREEDNARPSAVGMGVASSRSLTATQKSKSLYKI